MGAPSNSPSSNQTGAPPLSPSEARARDFLAQGRWRKARDEFKVLCKIDRAKYLPLLIQANVGLTREMLAKGLVSEAQPVLAYLKTIAAPAELQPLELEFALKSGDGDRQIACFIPLLTAPNAQLSDDEKRRLADQLVVAFQPIESALPDAARLAVEVGAVQQALQAVAAEQYESALAGLRPLPQSSLVSHWRLFVKGLVAFHQGDRDKAARCFHALPANSVPGRARLSYLVWLGEPLVPGKTTALRDEAGATFCRLVGAPGADRLIREAEGHWRAARPFEMYRLLRKNLSGFPSEGLDWMGTLTRFCFHCLFVLPFEEAGDYADALDDLADAGKTKNETELKLILRVLCLFHGADGGPEILNSQWQQFIGLVHHAKKPNPRLAAVAYDWLGNALATAPADPFSSMAAPGQPAFLSEAIEALRKSIELDPENLAAHLHLVEAYRLGHNHSERNRLLDDMTQRFPESKAVLVLAGGRCLDRKAYAKGAGYFARALALDRLDPAVPDALVTAKLLHAQQLFKDRRPDKARQLFDGLAELILDPPGNCVRSRWALQLRRGLLEQLLGDASLAGPWLAEARAASPSVAAFLVFAQTLELFYAPGHKSEGSFEREFALLCQNPVKGSEAVVLLRLHEYWQRCEQPSAEQQCERMIDRFLRAAAKSVFQRDDCRQVAELIRPHSHFSAGLAAWIKRGLKQDARDPLLRFYQWQHQRDAFTTPGATGYRLQPLLDEAVRRQDDHAGKLIRKELEAIKAHPPRPLPPPFEDEFEDVFSEDPGMEGDEVLDNLPPMGPEGDGLAQGIIELLRNASEAEIKKLRRTRPKGMPEMVFDAILNAVRQPLPLPTPSKPPNQPKPPPWADPNQLDLF